MAEFILSYEKYLQRETEDVNEGWKNWMATFMLLLNLGVVPPKLQAADLNDKIEWVQSIPKEQIQIAKFISQLNQNGELSPDFDKDDIQNQLTVFNGRNGTSIGLSDVLKYSDVQKYEDDGGNTKYKWTISVEQGDKMALDINEIQPAKYGMGVALVSDYGDFLSPTYEAELNRILFEYEKKTGVEIAILTIPSLYGQERADFTVNTFNRWGVGKKGGNNGILIMTSMGDRKWHITTGYGMEDIMTDYDCSSMGENYLVPNFKKGDYQQGYKDLIAAMQEKFGDIPIERTKELMKQRDKEQKEAIKNFFITAGEVLAFLAAMGLFAWAIVSGIKRRKKLAADIAVSKERIEKLNSDVAMLIENGDPIFNDNKVLDGLQKAAEALKTAKLSNESKRVEIMNEIDRYTKELRNIERIEREINKVKFNIIDYQNKIKSYEDKPTEIKDAAKKALDIIQSLRFENIDITDESVYKYQKTFTSMVGYYEKFKNLQDTFSNIEFKVGNIENTKNDLLGKLKQAYSYAAKVKELGYSSEVDVKEEDINSLTKYIALLGDIYKTDMTKAMSILQDYEGQTYKLGMELNKPVQKFQDIMTAKKYVASGDEDIQDKLSSIANYVRYGYLHRIDLENAQRIADKYKEDKSGKVKSEMDPYGEETWEEGAVKDVLKVAGLLKIALDKMGAIEDKGKEAKDEEERRKRREEEEEEERRRRKRQQEEDDERRRSSYSSSYSSSSSSSDYGGGGGGFSFGGGSSGGGGGGGSW